MPSLQGVHGDFTGAVSHKSALGKSQAVVRDRVSDGQRSYEPCGYVGCQLLRAQLQVGIRSNAWQNTKTDLKSDDWELKGFTRDEQRLRQLNNSPHASTSDSRSNAAVRRAVVACRDHDSHS